VIVVVQASGVHAALCNCSPIFSDRNKADIMGTILLIVLIILLLGGLPHYGYSRNWGYGPSGGTGLLLLVVLILVLMGRI
jgi:hypothetical protein